MLHVQSLIGFGNPSRGVPGTALSLGGGSTDDYSTTTFTGRAVIPASAITLPKIAPANARVSIKGSATVGFNLHACYLGVLSGTNGFLGPPTQMLFSGAGNFVGASNTVYTSDWNTLSFVWDLSTSLVFSYDFNSGADNQTIQTALGSATLYTKASVQDAANQSPSGYSNAGAIVDLLTKIEFDGYSS